MGVCSIPEETQEQTTLYCTKCGSPNSVEAQFCSRGGQPPMTILLGVLREKPVRITEKLSKAKPRDIKGVVCRGLPWVLFWPEILLSPIMRSRYKRIVMQSSSESSAEHALVDALRIVFLRHRGRSWAQIKAETGISKGTAQRATAGLPKTPVATAPPSA